MEGSFQEEFERSWLTSIIGVLIFFIAIYALTNNEGKAVHQHHSLQEAYTNVMPLNAFEKLQPEYDGRLVHISGVLTVDQTLNEPDYGVSIHAVKLKRRVQMYQWVEEHSSKPDDDSQLSTGDYYYVTEWRDKLVDSSNFYIRFGHENPKTKPLQTHIYKAPFVKVGPLTLSEPLKEKFTDFEEFTGGGQPERADIKLHMGIYYHCEDMWNPEVGDIRVKFYYAGISGDPVTIVAKQEKGSLVPYFTSKGAQIALVRSGLLTVPQMFNAEHWDTMLTTWKVRFFGTILILFAILCWSRLLKIIFNRFPYLTNLISGEATDPKNYLIAASVASFVIALSWISYRPMIGASLIFASISPFLYCVMGVYGAANNAFARNE